MTLTLGPILHGAGIDPGEAHVIRHAYAANTKTTAYRASTPIPPTQRSCTTRATSPRSHASSRSFRPAPKLCSSERAATGLWSVLENHGQTSNDGTLRRFDLGVSDQMTDLRNRLVIGWNSPRTWRINATTAAGYPVLEIADAQPVPFPGFDRLVLNYVELQAVRREHRYGSWRTALASVAGVYLITDTRNGRQYVGKADGSESIR